MFVDTSWTVSKRQRNNSDASDEKDKKKPCISDSLNSAKVFSKDNHIYFYGGVSKASVYKLQENILKLEDNFFNLQSKHPHVKMEKPSIYLHINSYGGGVFAAFAAIDMIQQAKLPVYTIVEGATASAGTLMSVVGKKRFIRPYASMLIHQLSSWFSGKMNEIEDKYKNLTQMMDTIKDIYKKHTNIPEEQVDDILKKDLWWNKEKCLEFGLVDKVWKPEH